MNITAGKYKGNKITAPNAAITRPTLSKVRMSVFNTLQSMIDFEGSTFLDMYAGSGIMGAEALSRNFTKALFIEKNKNVLKILKNNLSQFKNENYNIIFGDSLKICENITETFNIIYIDPPYYSGIYEQSLNAIKNIPTEIVILEHVLPVDFSDFEPIKQKKYGDKYITFLNSTKK